MSDNLTPFSITKSRVIAAIRVHFYALPAFWTDDRREAELFIKVGSNPETLRTLNELYHKGQFALLDNTFQEIENEALKQRTQEQADADAKRFNNESDGSRAC